MRHSICLRDNETRVFDKSHRAVADASAWIGDGRYLGLAALGVLLAVAGYVALTAVSQTARFDILAALVAGLGLIQVWQGIDGAPLRRALVGIGSGAAVITLAIASLPANAGLLAVAFLIAGVTAAAFRHRETGLWVPTATLALTLAVLSLA